MNENFLSNDNAKSSKLFFDRAVDIGLSFKLQEDVRSGVMNDLSMYKIVENLPTDGQGLDSIIKEFEENILPFCYNFASPNFMGFPDAGNSVAAITGNIIADFLQQNLINQSFCSPSGTFVEMAVIRWLREVVGYTNDEEVGDVFDVGGIITGGGTTSNAVGMLLARENFRANTMQNGVNRDDEFLLIVPKGIGHYSVKSSQMWMGCGNQLLEIDTVDYRYDLKKLKQALEDHKGRIMGVVAYAGDSRTMTVDSMREVAKVVRDSGQNIWLHADACHGFSLGFSDSLRHKIAGIEQFDSITTDPHKVLNTPYTISALLVREPQKLKTVASLSDLIMKEQYAFGQATPFVGSKPWASLKLWFVLKNLGKKGFGKIIDDRHALAVELSNLLEADEDFILLNKVDINSVAFLYKGKRKDLKADELNALNQAIHSQLIREGKYHLHQFSIPDAGLIEKDTLLYPLRFMCGNPLTEKKHLLNMLDYVRDLGSQIDSKGKGIASV